MEENYPIRPVFANYYFHARPRSHEFAQYIMFGIEFDTVAIDPVPEWLDAV